MKPLILALIALMYFSAPANAATWLLGNIWYGNVCRNGYYFTVYNPNFGQPVGTSCLVRDSFGAPLMYGVITAE